MFLGKIWDAFLDAAANRVPGSAGERVVKVCVKKRGGRALASREAKNFAAG